MTGGLSLALAASALRVHAETQAPFTLGVASGDPSPDGFVIWTRIAPDPLAADGLGGVVCPVTVKWSVYADEAMTLVAASGVVTTAPALAHTVHVEVEGLKPDRFYWYRFEAQGVRSAPGRGRTMPMPNAATERLNLVFASCSHYEKGYFSAYRHMAAENPDFVMFLGDYIYEYSYRKPSDRIVRRHERDDEVRDLAGYRNRYALYRTDPDLQALHACTSCLMTWDDHEVQNDYGGFLSQNINEDVGMVARRLAAYQAFYENMPLRRSSRLIGTHLDLYKGYRFGHLAEITMLDGRQYRSPQSCPVGNRRSAHVVTDACTDRIDPSRSMLGFAQEQWLYDRFAKSQATWNILGQDLLVASFTQKGRDAYNNPIVGHWTDGWDGYPATRDRLLAAMQHTRLKNPVMLGGDIHSYWATELKGTRDVATVATEFVGTSITADAPPYQPFADMLPQNPHIKYFNSRTHGYVSVTVEPSQMTTRFRAISDREDPNATVSTEVAFAVENGRAKLVQTS